MLIYKEDYWGSERRAGMTPRLERKIDEEVVRSVGPSALAAGGGSVMEIFYNKEANSLLVKVNLHNRRDQVVEVQIEGRIIPFSPAQAAAVGADAGTVTLSRNLGSRKETIPPQQVWWGTQEDLEEILHYPHLCGGK